MSPPRFESVPAVREGLRKVAYLADEGIAGVVSLADRLDKPVLIEGPAGTGKTQLAKSVAEMTGARLIRLQCYEGLDESKALYEWNYKKQLLEILSDYQVSIPELGTVAANQIPLVFLTSNNTRELSEALKRRCLYLHIDYPDLDREKQIVLTKVPDVTENLADQVARIVRSI